MCIRFYVSRFDIALEVIRSLGLRSSESSYSGIVLREVLIRRPGFPVSSPVLVVFSMNRDGTHVLSSVVYNFDGERGRVFAKSFFN